MNNKNCKIIIDTISGAILIGLISYFTTLFDSNPEYLKIIAYLWAVPLIYFYFLYITYKKGIQAVKSFTEHGLLGAVLTLIIMISTYLLILNNIDINTILIINIIYGFICLFVYFGFELYNKF
jgi:hypothetical protein